MPSHPAHPIPLPNTNTGEITSKYEHAIRYIISFGRYKRKEVDDGDVVDSWQPWINIKIFLFISSSCSWSWKLKCRGELILDLLFNEVKSIIPFEL